MTDRLFNTSSNLTSHTISVTLEKKGEFRSNIYIKSYPTMNMQVESRLESDINISSQSVCGLAIVGQFNSNVVVGSDSQSDIFIRGKLYSNTDITTNINTSDGNTTRELNSDIDIQSSTDSGLYIWGELHSTSNGVSTTESNGNTTRELNTTSEGFSETESVLAIFGELASNVTIVSKTTSDSAQQRRFNSTSDIVVVTESDGDKAQTSFYSTVAISSSNSCDALDERQLNTTVNIQAQTESTAAIANGFNSTVSIHSTVVSNIKYTIAGIKKLEYLSNEFINPHIAYKFDKFEDLIKNFLRFLDYNSINKTLDITKNNDVNKMYLEFINYFLNSYFNDVIDLTKYGLTEENKRIFLLINRLFHNSKGTVKSFEYLFRSITNIRIANNDINIDVDKIVTEYIEDESWWDLKDTKYYDGTYTYNGSIYYDSTTPRPFTYQFKIDQSRESMIPLIRAVHPAGFSQEFLINLAFEDQMRLTDSLKTSATYYHYYAYGVPGRTWYKYDGSITYAGFHVNTIEG